MSATTAQPATAGNIRNGHQAPSQGQVVRVRTRTWLVESTEHVPIGRHGTLVRMACLDDDAQGQACALVFVPSSFIVNEMAVGFAFDSYASFAVLQFREHEFWARLFSSSMKDDLRYAPSDCFETFSFPSGFETNAVLEAAGREYYEFRAALMVRNNEGLTKTYNRFHDPEESSPDIATLRELHAKMDAAVLAAYGWTDLPTTCAFILDYEDEESAEESSGRKRKKPWRFRWPDEVRDEVLARLLKLNAERAEQEKLSGEAAAAAKPKKSRGKKSAAAPAQDEIIPSPQRICLLECHSQ